MRVTLQTEENIRAGVAPRGSRQAVLKFGAVESVRESYHAEEDCHSSKVCCRTFVTPSVSCESRRFHRRSRIDTRVGDR